MQWLRLPLRVLTMSVSKWCPMNIESNQGKSLIQMNKESYHSEDAYMCLPFLLSILGINLVYEWFWAFLLSHLECPVVIVKTQSLPTAPSCWCLSYPIQFLSPSNRKSYNLKGINASCEVGRMLQVVFFSSHQLIWFCIFSIVLKVTINMCQRD